jgi:hypothetical protein
MARQVGEVAQAHRERSVEMVHVGMMRSARVHQTVKINRVMAASEAR